MRLAALLPLLLVASCTRRSFPSPDVLYRDSEALLKRGDPKAALSRAEQGLEREPSWRFRLLKAEILLTAGQALEAGRYLESIPAPDEPQARALWRMFQAQADYMQSDYQRAAPALEEAAQVAAAVHSSLLDAKIEMRRASLALRRGDTAAADPMFRRVLQIAIGSGDDYLAANALGNLGYLYLNASRYDQAIYWLERAREVFARLQSEVLYARTLGNLGACYYRLGDYEKAIAYSQEAARRSGQAGNKRDQQTWLGTIATARLDQGEYAEAARDFRDVLGIALETGDKESAAWWLNNLTLASIHLGDLDAAERYNRQTLELGISSWSDYYRRVHEAEIAAARHDWPRAEKFFRAVLTLNSVDPAPVLDAYAGLAQTLIQSGRAADADAEFRTALALIERQRSQLIREEYRLSYLSSLIDMYQQYVDFLVDRGEVDRALEVAESSRARVLDEKLRSTREESREAAPAALKQLARSSGCALVSYWLAPRRSFVWTVTADRIDLEKLPPDKQIAPLVEEYRSFLEALRDPLDTEFPAGKELSRILLGPVRDRLAGSSCVVLVPDRSLDSLNFETLPDPADPSRYWIERVTLSLAPSLGLLAGAPRAAASKPSILLIGDPQPAVEEYPRLPYAGEEMAGIAHEVRRAEIFEGVQATPAIYREAHPETFTWIHFAAHASVNRDSPLDSALILSPGAGGYALSAREVMQVPLHAALVTLSACRSAGAKTYSGEGLVGLSWAFLRAGARSVVAGLWDVTDASTAKLMSDFYSRMVSGETPAQALREAKLRMIHSTGAYRKPFYWAPFQLYTGSQ